MNSIFAQSWPMFLAGALLLVTAFVLHRREQKRVRRLEGLAYASKCPVCASANLTSSSAGLDCQECRCTFTIEAVQRASKELADRRAVIAANKRENKFFDFEH